MDALRFDRLSKALADRRSSRHKVAQEATPAATDESDRSPELLFVQTFRAGAIAPKEGAEGRYTLTLEAGSGQTIYFSDRPDRRVGTDPTPQFLERLGFPDDNPPNAALVVETASGETDVAVVELFDPLYDPVTQGVTYEIEVLANWQDELGLGLHEAPTDLAALAPSFGAAHLFIDGLLDCPSHDIVCREVGREGTVHGTIPVSWLGGFCSHGLFEVGSEGEPGAKGGQYCVPCSTPSSLLGELHHRGHTIEVYAYWRQRCSEMFPSCGGKCFPSGWCGLDPYYQNSCPFYGWS